MTMRRTMPLAIAALFMLLLCSVEAGDQDPLAPPAGEGWKKVSEASGKNAVYARDQAGSDIQALLEIGILNYTPKEVFDVCTDYGHYQEFMPYAKFSHIVHVEKPKKGERISYVYYFLKPPLISPRYYTLCYKDEMNITYKGIPGCYLSTWDLVKDGVYHTTPDSPGVNQVEHKSGAVELEKNAGWWRFEPVGGGKKTRMVYYVVMSSGGNLPHWVQNKAQKTSVKSIYDAINDRLKEVEE